MSLSFTSQRAACVRHAHLYQCACKIEEERNNLCNGDNSVMARYFTERTLLTDALLRRILAELADTATRPADRRGCLAVLGHMLCREELPFWVHFVTDDFEQTHVEED